MTSDEFFEHNADKTFDLVFIDGCHLSDQVEKDILNSLKQLEQGGTIVMHDTNPPTAYHARENSEMAGPYKGWNGTSWQAFARLRKNRSDLEMFTIDCDWGLGVIRFGHQSTIDVDITSFDDLAQNRDLILNLISVKRYLREYMHA